LLKGKNFLPFFYSGSEQFLFLLKGMKPAFHLTSFEQQKLRHIKRFIQAHLFTYRLPLISAFGNRRLS
jgi:asparagine synthetase B (glutamine-hydrolysing)